MDEKVTLVIGLTVLIVVSVNVILFFGFRDRSLPYQIELFRRAAQRARDPWQDEDDALEGAVGFGLKIRESRKSQRSRYTNTNKEGR